MKLKVIWNEISTLGTEAILPDELSEKVMLCNRLAFTIGVVIMLAAFTFYQVPVLFGLYMVAGITYLSPLLFNFLKLHTTSRIVLTFTPPIFILLGAGWATQGPAIGLKYALLSVLIVPVLLFQRSEKTLMWLGLAWVMLALLSYDPITDAIPRLPELQSDAQLDSLLAQNINVMVSLVLFVAGFRYQQRINQHTEWRLREALAEAEQKKAVISEKNRQLSEQYNAIEIQKRKIEHINQELRLQALKAQINPHFLFNVLNSIQHFVLQKNTAEALTYLSKFARLIRQILENSINETVPVADDLTALRYYLDLEQLRFNHAFGYQIEIDDQLDEFNTEIPAMLLQPYVENAILHGLRHRRDGLGLLKIWILYQYDHLLCIVEDNGIGRAASGKINAGVAKEHISRGTILADDRLRLMKEGSRQMAGIITTDLYGPDKCAAGTRVEISVPL